MPAGSLANRKAARPAVLPLPHIRRTHHPEDEAFSSPFNGKEILEALNGQAITLIVGCKKTEFKTTKELLNKVPFFLGMFRSGLMESSSEEIELPKEDEDAVGHLILWLLRGVYNFPICHPTENSDIALDPGISQLILLADKWCVSQLITALCSEIWEYSCCAFKEGYRMKCLQQFHQDLRDTRFRYLPVCFVAVMLESNLSAQPKMKMDLAADIEDLSFWADVCKWKGLVDLALPDPRSGKNTVYLGLREFLVDGKIDSIFVKASPLLSHIQDVTSVAKQDSTKKWLYKLLDLPGLQI